MKKSILVTAILLTAVPTETQFLTEAGKVVFGQTDTLEGGIEFNGQDITFKRDARVNLNVSIRTDVAADFALYKNSEAFRQLAIESKFLNVAIPLDAKIGDVFFVKAGVYGTTQINAAGLYTSLSVMEG